MDDDECMLETDNCDQVCMNTDGGFSCDCDPGFQLNSDQSTCTGENDIVEIKTHYDIPLPM